MTVMDYYYELVVLMGKVNIEESKDVTQDRFIHGLNVNLKHKVQIEVMWGLSMDDVLGFAEIFEHQVKEVALKGKMVVTHTSTGIRGNKGSGAPKKEEISIIPNLSNQAQLKALLDVPPNGEKKVQCYKLKGCGKYSWEYVNKRVMMIGHDGDVYSEDEEELSSVVTDFLIEDELVEKKQALVAIRMLSVCQSASFVE